MAEIFSNQDLSSKDIQASIQESKNTMDFLESDVIMNEDLPEASNDKYRESSDQIQSNSQESEVKLSQEYAIQEQYYNTETKREHITINSTGLLTEDFNTLLEEILNAGDPMFVNVENKVKIPVLLQVIGLPKDTDILGIQFTKPYPNGPIAINANIDRKLYEFDLTN